MKMTILRELWIWMKDAVWFLRISRPGVRVPSIAPRKTRTRLCSGFSFCQHDGRGSNRAAAHSAASKATVRLCLACGSQRLGMSTVEAVNRKISWLFCFVSHGCAVAERVRLIPRRFKTEKMEFHIDKTSRQVYNRTWKQQGIAAKSVRMPLWIETG